MGTIAEIMPGPSDRACFIGTTGCGKTTLARYVLEREEKRRIFVHDPKNQIRWPGYKRYSTLKKFVGSNHPKRIYAPNENEFDDPVYWNAFFKLAFKLKNCVVYVDEATLITERDELPRYYKACIMQGRGLNVSVLTATQRPMLVPQIIMSESEHKYIFRLNMPQDRKKAEEITGIDREAIFNLQKRYFYYASAETNRIRGPLTLKLQ